MKLPRNVSGATLRGLKPYPETKDSGVEWLGEIPAHWKVLRLKHICRMAYGDALAGDVRQDGAVQVFGSNGRVGFHDAANTEAPCIVIGRKGSFGKVNYSDEPVFAIDTTFLVDSRFSSANLRWLFFFLTWLRLDDGTRDSAVPGLDREGAYQRLGILPPLSEQAAIVRFLDHADRRIRRYIRAKQKLIALLKEQKQGVINQAVTGQIDVRTGRAYPTYKPSGLRGLAEVPKDWKLCRLRNVVSVVTTGSRGWSSYASDTGPLFVRVANLSRGSLELRFNDEMRLDLPPTSEAGRTRIEPGDLLVSVTAYIGSVGVAPKRFEEAYVSQHVARCQPLPDMHARWLGYVLLSTVGQTHGQISLYGGTKDGLALDDVKNYPILLPPRHVQDQAVRWIEGKLSALVKIGENTKREIAMAGEYRTRLIADVVTGKLDVREAAAGLPDVDSLAADDMLDGGNATHDVSDSESEVATSERDEFENLVRDERSGPDGHEVRA